MIQANKSQISIFIVIGALLILVITFLLLSGDFDFFASPQDKLTVQIKDTVETCIEDSATQGIFLLSMKGGIIEVPPGVILRNEYVTMGFPIASWDSNSISIPTRESMQEELTTFVLNRSKTCIDNDLSKLSDLAQITYDLSDLELLTLIADEKVTLEASLLVAFSPRGSEELISLDNYFITLKDQKLGSLHDLALTIYSYEEATYFLEDLVLDQIYSASDYSVKESMPSEGMFFTCFKPFWTKNQLKENLVSLNNNNFRYLQIEGTANIESRFDAHFKEEYGTLGLRDYFESHYKINVGDLSELNKNYEVSIAVPQNELTTRQGIVKSYSFREFDVTPSSGEIVKPITMKVGEVVKFPLPCIQIYHHLYNLDYDLVVTLEDVSSESSSFFRFPIRIQIDNNEPKSRISTPIVEKESQNANERYCTSEGGEYPLQVFAVDEINQEYLNNVNISYECVALNCEMGKTQKPRYEFNPDIERKYATPYLETNFPYCIGGNIIANKEGYHTSKVRVDTTEELIGLQKTQSVDIELTPLKTYTFDESTFLLYNTQNGAGSRIREGDEGFIYVTIENGANDFSSYGIWPNDGVFNEINSLALLDKEGVTYNVSIVYATSNYELLGLLELRDIEINSQGSELRVTIPTSSTTIDENSYEAFVELSTSLYQTNRVGITTR